MTATTARVASTPVVVAAVNRWWWQATGAAITAAWIVVALADTARVPPLAAAAAAATALLAAAPTLAVAGAPSVGSVIALVGLPVAVAEAAHGGQPAPLGALLGAVLLLEVVIEYRRGAGANAAQVMLAIGAGGVVTGLAAAGFEADVLRLAVAHRPSAALVLAGSALVFAAIDDHSGAERALLAPVGLAAVLAAPALPPLAVALAWGAFGVGAALFERPAAAFAGLAVAATAAGLAPAGLLFLAAAVLAAALDSRLAALCGLPAAVAFVDGLSGRSASAASTAALVAVALAALALAVRLKAAQRLDGGRAMAALVAIWLVVAPGSWGFVGPSGLHAYDVAAIRAVATGGLIALALMFRRGAEIVVGDEAVAPLANTVPSTDPLGRHPAVGLAAVTAATVASVGWLVVSVVRLH